MSPYIQALAIIAKRADIDSNLSNTRHAITISLYTSKKAGPKSCKASKIITVEYSPVNAQQKLKDIYNEAFIGTEGNPPFSKAVPVELLNKSFPNISSFEKALKGENGQWEYFPKKDLFDIKHDVGYTPKGFNTEWANAANKMKSLTKLIDDDGNKTAEENADCSPA